MEKVLNQAELLAEAILESEEYIAMRLAEQAAMKDEMRQTNEAFTQMMKKVNSIIKFVVTGENDEEEHGCSGSCEGCSGCGHQH